MDRVLIGDTVVFTFVHSATPASTINLSIFDGAETLVSSKYAVDSGDSLHWYALEYFDPGSYSLDAYYSVQFDATIGDNKYRRKMKIRVVKDGVD